MTITEQITASLKKVGQALYAVEVARVAYNTAKDQKLGLIQIAHREGDAGLTAAKQDITTCKNQWSEERYTYLNLMQKKAQKS